ncbi:MAG: ABC transporter permease [Alistipes sp.]|jgi:ABC-2 type transport system permease protein|nr:ABC transporter permease [Alistipes sp.]
MIRFLIEKEFKQIRRNAFVPRIILMMPVTMILVFPWAADQEVRDVRLAVVDGDRTSSSRRLVEKVASSGRFTLTDVADTWPAAMESVEAGRADIVLEIARGFEKATVTPDADGSAKISIAANAVNGTKGTLGTSYLTSILNDFAGELLADAGGAGSAAGVPSVVPQYRFNPRLDYKVFMVPALMVMLLTLLCGFLPALNIVGEKEAGTIEQINVTPVRRLDFVLAKLIPYWLIGFVVLGVSMGLAAAVYGLYPAGSLLTILLFAGIYILVVSGVGLVISNYSESMQQAMFVMFFFTMIFLLMSGLFTPVASMPRWAQAIAAVNPLKYFIEVMRLVYLKGSGLGQLLPQLAALCGFAVAFNVWAVFSYRKSE